MAKFNILIDGRFTVNKILSSEITPEHLYLSRRKFLIGAGTVAVGAVLSACGIKPPASSPAASSAASPTSTGGQTQ